MSYYDFNKYQIKLIGEQKKSQLFNKIGKFNFLSKNKT